MILSKAGKLFLLAGLLCLLLMVFNGASYGASIKWDVFPSPTEVINTGRSEVVGSISLSLTLGQGGTVITGSTSGGPTQIGIIYSNGLQIDNTPTTGIRVFAPRFASSPIVVTVQNLTITGRCQGFLTLNIPAGVTLFENDPTSVIRIDGVRGRIDQSDGATAGTDLFSQMQSINDPSANSFFPETVRIAKSLPGLVVDVTDDVLLLCFPTLGTPPAGTIVPKYKIRVTEGFIRAFVAADSGLAGIDSTDRVDSSGGILGAPTNDTQIHVILNSIPSSVSGVIYPATVQGTGTNATSWLAFVSVDNANSGRVDPISSGLSGAVYAFKTSNQSGFSDTNLESFDIVAQVVLKTQQSVGGKILAAASLWPRLTSAERGSGYPTCAQPGDQIGTSSSWAQPRFTTLWQSNTTTPGVYVSSTDSASTIFHVYATITPCNCYLLFTFVSKTPFFDTGLAIANTSDDGPVFGGFFNATTNPLGKGAPKQSGPVTLYFFDKDLGFVGSTTTTSSITAGKSFVTLLSQVLPTGVTAFQGYVIAQAQFQYCHGFAFIGDTNFATIAQGYIASVIPDPAVIGSRLAAAAADQALHVPAGESLNN